LIYYIYTVIKDDTVEGFITGFYREFYPEMLSFGKTKKNFYIIDDKLNCITLQNNKIAINPYIKGNKNQLWNLNRLRLTDRYVKKTEEGMIVQKPVLKFKKEQIINSNNKVYQNKINYDHTESYYGSFLLRSVLNNNYLSDYNTNKKSFDVKNYKTTIYPLHLYKPRTVRELAYKTQYYYATQKFYRIIKRYYALRKFYRVTFQTKRVLKKRDETYPCPPKKCKRRVPYWVNETKTKRVEKYRDETYKCGKKQCTKRVKYWVNEPQTTRILKYRDETYTCPPTQCKRSVPYWTNETKAVKTPYLKRVLITKKKPYYKKVRLSRKVPYYRYRVVIDTKQVNLKTDNSHEFTRFIINDNRLGSVISGNEVKYISYDKNKNINLINNVSMADKWYIIDEKYINTFIEKLNHNNIKANKQFKNSIIKSVKNR